MPPFPTTLFASLVSAGVAIAIAAVVVAFTFGRKKKPVALSDPNVKFAIRLVDKEIISHDTRRFRFALPSPQHILGLPVGQYIYLSAKINGEMVVRPYTPVTSNDEEGYVDFVIKVYKRGVNPNFPNGGKMTQFLDAMAINDYVYMRGPAGSLLYIGRGQFFVPSEKKGGGARRQARCLSMIAGGSGITPILQLVRAIIKDKKDDTAMALIFSNKTENDILLRDELENIRDQFPGRFRLWFTLSQAPAEGWSHGVGHVDESMIRSHLFPPGEGNLVLLCGPPGLVNATCHPCLDSLNYTRDWRFTF